MSCTVSSKGCNYMLHR
uniref:Uncharacterized protein n=1 Tax=Arundo donax TaxID=35708 RepID=A0A0A9CES2_ARUDO